MKIAIVGTGIAGNVVAHRLHRAHDITVYEAAGHIGGHTHTHRIELDSEVQQVDTGFIVFNHRTYPHFVQLLGELGVASHDSAMSFSVRNEATLASLERDVITLSPSMPNEIPSGNFRDSSPLGPFTDTVEPSMSTVTPFGTGTGILPIRDMCGPPYQTRASSSPPVWARRACASDMRPLEVLRMAMPRPLRTRGISPTPT